ncbi:cytochrome P450 monooxygenase CYP63 [Ceratobasidium sp. AG-I]|nr:cytochrome P450 monooxygenase CYP63 [Ceratobasidium sp. AG-I]
MGYNHRRVWLLAVARFIGFPAFTLNVLLHIARLNLESSHILVSILNSKIAQAGLYVLAVPTFWSIRNVFRTMLRKREADRMGARMIPCVKGKWPGNIDILFRMVKSLNGGYVAELAAELFEEYGTTINIRLLWEDAIMTADHEVIKYVLSTGFSNFGKGVKRQNRMESFLGDGIFNRDGDLWKFHRSMTRPFFARERISEFELFDRYTQKLITRLSEHSDRDAAVDVQDLFARLTMDAAGEFLFSTTDINSLDGVLPVAGKAKIGPRGTACESGYGDFVNAFEESQALIPKRGRLGPHIWPALELGGDKAKPHRELIDKWLQPLLDAAFTRRAKWISEGGDTASPAGDTFLDDLVSSTEDRTLIADELVNILLAARDTTATLLTFAAYLFTQHPEVYAKVRAEVMEHVGPTAASTYGQVKAMKYVRAVLNETLRLFPPIPINERATNNPVAVPSSQGRLYISGPNTQIMYVPVLMQRRTDLWGPDAEEFDPERWLDERNRAFVADPMRFVPFDAGPRICLGQQFALNEASFVVARLAQRFDQFELAMEAAPEGSIPPPEWKKAKGRKGFEKVWPKNAVTIYSKGGVWVKARKVQA